jgi:hypothetical protein
MVHSYSSQSNCLFNQPKKYKCNMTKKEKTSFNDYPLPNPMNPAMECQVKDTALMCPGIPYKIGDWSGYNGKDIEYDSWFRTRDNIERTKGKTQLNARSFSNAYFGSGEIFGEIKSKFNVVGEVSQKHKTYIENQSTIPYKFYYHFENPQKTTFLPKSQDTRMELRRILSNKCNQ